MRELAQLISKMSAAILAVYPAPLHYREPSGIKHKVLEATGYDGTITMQGKIFLRGPTI